jgi:tetratricopeptide (TPR) repeat protein
MSVSPHIALAERQINLGNSRGAIEPLRRALAADPNHALAHAYLAVCLQDVREGKAAVQSIGSALALAPEHWYVQFAAGRIALQQQRYQEAEKHLDDARRTASWNAPVYRHLADLYRQTKRAGTALEVLEEGLGQCPGDVGIISEIGTELLNRGHLELAEIRALEALSLDPESIDAHVVAGYVRLWQNCRAEALDHALSALSINAAEPAAVRLLCMIKVHANPLLGLWWRLAAALSQYPNDALADFLKLAWTVCFAGIFFLFWAGQTWVAVALIATLALWIAGMGLCKIFLEWEVRRELMAFRLRKGF